jgi:hypothetical protein
VSCVISLICMGMSVSWLLSICKAVKFVSCNISTVSKKIREGEGEEREKREREEGKGRGVSSR